MRLGWLRSHVRREVDAEIDFHFAEAVDEHVRRGLSEHEAVERAHRRFGDERAYRQALERIDHGGVRMRNGSEGLDSVARALGHASRGIRRNPGFALSMTAILALGIGANAVMFGVVDRLLLSPPQHVVQPDGVRRLYVEREIFNGDVRVGSTITYPDYLDFEDVGAFAEIGAYNGPIQRTVGRGDAAARARVVLATASLFRVLGVQPALGRFFTDDEDVVEAPPTAVLAHEYWEREHGADVGVLGRTIDVGDATYEIIGVAPAGYTGSELSPVDVWLPMSVAEALESGTGWVESRGWYFVNAIVRMGPDATVEAAEAEATAAHLAGRADMIAEDRYDEGARVLVSPLITAQGPSPTDEARVARWLAGVSLIVLLIACFNAANLLLARAIRARREVAVRLALGVSRRRLVVELMTESVMLAGLGATAALALAYTLNGPVHQVLLPDVAFTDVDLSTRLLAFTAVAALVAGVVAGILPAVQATRTELADALKAGGRGVSGGGARARVGLLVGQAALSVVLLVGAGLFVRSLSAASSLDLGFDARNVVVVRFEWNETLESGERTAIYERALEGVRRIPGVHAAGLSYTVNFRSSISLGQPRIPGRDSIPRHHSGGPYVNKVGSGYFEAMGLSIVQGRPFLPSDDSEDAPLVAVVSESMARAVWPDGEAVGSCMLVGGEDAEACTEVVGVVENHRRQALVEADEFLYFVNASQPEFQGPPQAMMVGTVADAATMAGLIHDEAGGASDLIRFVNADAMQSHVDPQLRSWRLGASMFTAFGVLALIVAAWGLYSVLAFDVALRRQELGIRSALGAGSTRIVTMVLRRAIAMVAAGTGLGLVASWSAARFVEPLLFEVSPTDLPVYAVVGVTLVAAAVAAGTLPAMRAGRVDPTEALQTE